MAITTTPSPSHGDPNPNPNPTTICTIFAGDSTFISDSLISALLRSTSYSLRFVSPILSPPHLSKSPRLSFIQSIPLHNPDRHRSTLRNSSVAVLVDPTLSSADPTPLNPLDLYNLTVVTVKNVVAACVECGVRRLIYVGSADVVLDGLRNVHNVDESVAYPERFENLLNEFRAQAERIVLLADRKGGMSSCVLRVSNPFGPGDRWFVPFLIRKARFIVGSGNNLCDFTYVDNVAHAVVCAEQALLSDVASSVAGKPFFITNHEPVNLWHFISGIVEALGYKRPSIHVPVYVVLYIVMLVKRVRGNLGLCPSPNLTSNVIHMLCYTRTFDVSKAQRLLGYSPVVSLEEGLRITAESFSKSAAKEPLHFIQRDFVKSSEADKLLGSGKVASILLWRDEKKTFSCFIVSVLLFYWFILSGRTFISSSAKLLLLIAVILFGHGNLPSSIFGYSVEKISLSHFEVSETTTRHLFSSVAYVWNKSICMLRLLAEGDWILFLKVAGPLYFAKVFLPLQLSVFLGVGLVCLFSFFIIYEKQEKEVEKVMATAEIGFKKLGELITVRVPGSLGIYVRKR